MPTRRSLNSPQLVVRMAGAQQKGQLGRDQPFKCCRSTKRQGGETPKTRLPPHPSWGRPPLMWFQDEPEVKFRANYLTSLWLSFLTLKKRGRVLAHKAVNKKYIYFNIYKYGSHPNPASPIHHPLGPVALTIYFWHVNYHKDMWNGKYLIDINLFLSFLKDLFHSLINNRGLWS